MHSLKPYREAKLSNAMITVIVVGNVIITSVLMALFSTPPMA